MPIVDTHNKAKVNDFIGAKRDLVQEVIDFSGETDLTTGFVEKVTVIDDGITPSASWVDRFVGFFKPSAVLASRMVIWFNEYLELRLAPAKHNTTALRIFVRDSATVQSTQRDADVPLFEMMDDRVNRNSIFGLHHDGEVRINEVPMNWVMSLGPLDDVPDGTPAGTIIVRTT